MKLINLKSLTIVVTWLCSSAYDAVGNDVNLPPAMDRLTESEMDTYHGGFVTPGGLEIDIGLSVQTQMSPASGQNIVGPNSGLVQYIPNASEVLIQNSLSNLTIQATTQLNVDVANYSQIHGQLAIMGQNLINGSSGLLH